MRLTVKQTADIERVQRVALAVILSDVNTRKFDFNYDRALVTFGLEPLKERRILLCNNFAKKTLKSRHAGMFVQYQNLHYTRNKQKFYTASCNTKRFFDSPLNYLTRLLNDQ